MKIFSLVLLLILSSCGASPLFNHEIESDKGGRSAVLSDSEALLFKKTDHAFTISWEEGPRLGESKFLMKTWNKNTGSVSGPYQDLPKTLHVFLWMPAMGHGSSPVTLTRIGEGEFEVSDIQFIMGGLWQVRFQLKEGNQVFDETIITVSI